MEMDRREFSGSLSLSIVTEAPGMLCTRGRFDEKLLNDKRVYHLGIFLVRRCHSNFASVLNEEFGKEDLSVVNDCYFRRSNSFETESYLKNILRRFLLFLLFKKGTSRADDLCVNAGQRIIT